ncbi:MAG: cyclase family protein [Spirochaetaceae bacterium]|nr:MAG: cyclase family protein [Spirochaetaceae bacterium]
MTIIDLSAPIYSGMPVYPGDPEIEFTAYRTIETDGWAVTMMSLGTHTGTHVDAYSHMVDGGEAIDRLPLSRFVGPAFRVEIGRELPRAVGLVFGGLFPTRAVAETIAAAPVFVAAFEIEPDAERALLEARIVTYTGVVNVEALPLGVEFTFIGLPLPIRDGDGSPVRAVAILSD